MGCCPPPVKWREERPASCDLRDGVYCSQTEPVPRHPFHDPSKLRLHPSTMWPFCPVHRNRDMPGFVFGFVLFSVWGPHPVIHRGYSWLCSKESLVVVLGDPLGCQGSISGWPHTSQTPSRLHYHSNPGGAAYMVLP